MRLGRLYSILIFSVLFVVSQYIQFSFLSSYRIGLNSAAFYIPASVALFSILIINYYSAISLLLGATIANYYILPDNDLMMAVTKGSIYAAGCFLTALILDKVIPKFNGFTRPKADLNHLDAYDVMIVCVIYSVITNLIFRTYFVYILEIAQPVDKFLLRIFGDFSGAFMVFIGFNICFVIFKYLKTKFGGNQTDV